jgi:hypothetical protein
MKRKFLLAGLVLAISLIWVGASAQTYLVTNGYFEGVFSPSGNDQIPNGWTKLETNEPPESSFITWAADNGPTHVGSKSLHWVRYNGSNSGDWTVCEQTLNYDVSDCFPLKLTIDVKAFYHNVGGSGWTPTEYEYPVTIVIYYTDIQGTQRYWQWGWYLWTDAATGPPPNHKQVPGNGVVTAESVGVNVWVAKSFDLSSELYNPKTINSIRVGGAGWDFEGRADNVQIICQQKGWYRKPSYLDYAPSGMPDFDQKQDNWKKGAWQYTFCGPVAVANCFWWFDSKYNIPAGVPGDANDRFPLVRDYLDGLAPRVGLDDHDPWNVNHVGTVWFPGGTPPITPQPFVPGAQTPGGGVTSWGELVERLAWYMNTDGRRTGSNIMGTKIDSMQAGIDRWFKSETFSNGSTLADTLYEKTWKKPTFAQVESLVEMSQDVILLLGFWYENPPGSQQWFRCGGHYVTVAAVNSDSLLIAISDPYYDWAEEGNPGRIGNGWYITHTIPHTTDPTIHNDAGNVSQDIYAVIPASPSPGGVWSLPNYPVSLNPSQCEFFDTTNVPDEFKPVSAPWPGGGFPIFTEVEYAVEISPWEYPPDCGDMQPDGAVNIQDIVYLINYKFMVPPGPPPYNLVKADVNHDGVINVQDIVYLINYKFMVPPGPAPKCYAR